MLTDDCRWHIHANDVYRPLLSLDR
jgi:hypothetical protein